MNGYTGPIYRRDTGLQVCLGVHEQLDWSHIQVIYRAAQSV